MSSTRPKGISPGYCPERKRTGPPLLVDGRRRNAGVEIARCDAENVAQRLSHVIGFDDAPFERAHRGDVLIEVSA
jgi:hypothetical protein